MTNESRVLELAVACCVIKPKLFWLLHAVPSPSVLVAVAHSILFRKQFGLYYTAGYR